MGTHPQPICERQCTLARQKGRSRAQELANTNHCTCHRLASVLSLLAHFGKESTSQPVMAQVNQGTVAEMIGTTHSRVSYFMNKFRKLRFIEYNGELRVHSPLLNILLHD